MLLACPRPWPAWQCCCRSSRYTGQMTLRVGSVWAQGTHPGQVFRQATWPTSTRHPHLGQLSSAVRPHSYRPSQYHTQYRTSHSTDFTVRPHSYRPSQYHTQYRTTSSSSWLSGSSISRSPHTPVPCRSRMSALFCTRPGRPTRIPRYCWLSWRPAKGRRLPQGHEAPRGAARWAQHTPQGLYLAP